VTNSIHKGQATVSEMTSNNDPTTLTQTFNYTSSTHTNSIKWTSLGAPTNPPLIFIHGTPWSSRVWSPFALALSRKFHVYLFDNPGFGASPLELELELAGQAFQARSEVEGLDADLARQSEVFAALYKSWEAEWKGKKAHVIAHDHAGLMSLRAFLLHDCSYASLCLINVVAIGPFGQSLFHTVASNPSYFLSLPDSIFDGILESYIRAAAFAKLSDETMTMLKEPWMREGGKEGFVRQLCQANSRTTGEVEGRYREIGGKIPVRIIWGAQDRWIPVETAERLGKALETEDIVRIEGAGHLIMYDQPGQLGVELGGWLRGVSS
jgi:pimeloyl-ACP methyl ester carboxylesterase